MLIFVLVFLANFFLLYNLIHLYLHRKKKKESALTDTFSFSVTYSFRYLMTI